MHQSSSQFWTRGNLRTSRADPVPLTRTHKKEHRYTGTRTPNRSHKQASRSRDYEMRRGKVREINNKSSKIK